MLDCNESNTMLVRNKGLKFLLLLRNLCTFQILIEKNFSSELPPIIAMNEPNLKLYVTAN